MPQVHLPPHHSAFHGGRQVVRVYQGTTQVWPVVVSTAASTVIAGQNVVVPHFDVELEQGVTNVFPPKWRTPQNQSRAPYSAGEPPYGYPELYMTFRVARIDNATGPVSMKIGVVPYPGQPLQADTRTSTYFSYQFDNLAVGSFYAQRTSTSVGWDDFKPEDANLVWMGELTNATKVYLTNVTMMLTW
jgi:hypothetical protein